MSTQSEPRGITAWVGWVWFAAWLVGLAGVFQIIAGLVSIIRGDEYFGPTTQVAVDMGYAAWGWIHIFIGLFLISRRSRWRRATSTAGPSQCSRRP